MLYLRRNPRTLKDILKLYKDDMLILNEVPDENLQFFNLINLNFPITVVTEMTSKSKIKILNNEKFIVTIIYFLQNHIKIEGKFLEEYHRSFQRKIEEFTIEWAMFDPNEEPEKISEVLKEFENLN